MTRKQKEFRIKHFIDGLRELFIEESDRITLQRIILDFIIIIFFSLFSGVLAYYLIGGLLHFTINLEYIFFFLIILVVQILLLKSIISESNFLLSKKITNFWLLFGLVLSLFVVSFGYQYLSSLYVDVFPQKFQFEHHSHGLNITYNLINLETGHKYALRGDRICFNMTIKNSNPYMVHVYIGGQIVEPTGKVRIIENITYNTAIVNFESNTIRNNDENCEAFTELGLNKFYPYLKIKSINETYKKLEEIHPNGIYVYVNSESEYNDIINKKNFSFIIALATIPTILFTIKTLRDLHRNK